MIKIKKHFLRNINTICLPGAKSCAMSCDYCYAGFGQKKTSSESISFPLIDKSLNFLIDYLDPFEPPMLVIGFGGDPIESLKYVEYAQNKVNTEQKYKRIKVAINTTHGLNLKEDHLVYLEKNSGFLAFSIDGTKETHNKSRKTKNGNDSYDEVIKSYHMAKDRLRCAVNCTITPVSNMKEDILHLYNLGFKIITAMPVRPGQGHISGVGDKAFSESIIAQYTQFIESLYTLDDETLVGVLKALTTDDYFNKILKRFVKKDNHHRKCGAAFNFIYVTENGAITPCSSFRKSLGTDYVIGSLDDGIDLEKIEFLFSFSTIVNEPCKSCKVQKICSGFCFKNSLSEGDLATPSTHECELALSIIPMVESFYLYLEKNKARLLGEYIKHDEFIEKLDLENYKAME